MTPQASIIWQQLQDRGISVRAVAARMGIHPGHMQRVLKGERKGSRAFLNSIAETLQGMPDPRHPVQDDVVRLIDSATHVFFLKRGAFESAIFNSSTEKDHRCPNQPH